MVEDGKTFEKALENGEAKRVLVNKWDKVKLTKRGDELFVSIGNFKRELLLPSVLAHRPAGGAVFSDGVLRVRFPAPAENAL